MLQAIATRCQILGGVKASLRLHNPLLERVVHAPVAFFDTTPLGRILNRFGKEFETIDLRLSASFRMLANSFLMVAQVVVVVAISTPFIILLDVPVSILYILILRYFIASSRQLQRRLSFRFLYFIQPSYANKAIN